MNGLLANYLLDSFLLPPWLMIMEQPVYLEQKARYSVSKCTARPASVDHVSY